jgi:hypothetical protein
MTTSPDRGASYSRLIRPQSYPRFFSFSGDRLSPAGLLIVQNQNGLKSHGQTDPGPIRPLS